MYRITNKYGSWTAEKLPDDWTPDVDNERLLNDVASGFVVAYYDDLDDMAVTLGIPRERIKEATR